MAYVYLLRCADGSLYCGWTTDIDKRLEVHNSGKGSKYTRARLPVSLVYHEHHPNRGEAMAREYSIKKMSRKEKMQLIREGVLPNAIDNSNRRY